MFGWFKPKQYVSPSPFADDVSPGEVEKVVRIKQLCRMAGMSGESIVGIIEADLQDEKLKYEFDRFWSLQYEALDLAREIVDEIYRDAALQQLINSYMKANYEHEARKLYAVITTDIIRESVLKNYPHLDTKV